MDNPEHPSTPLSDLIEAHANSGDDGSYQHFLDHFCQASVGVFATGAPADVSGTFTSTKEHPVSVRSTTDPEGRTMILAFADPIAFSRNFGTPFNAEMPGSAVLATVLQSPDCEGIRVNSAKAEVSMFISQASAAQQLGTGGFPQAAKSKPWWKRW